MQKNPNKKETKGKKNEPLPGNPVYSASEDIYNREKKESIDGDIVPGEKGGDADSLFDTGLDVPGSELDDKDELVGSEDEENNYYSLGGDNHEDLEEDKG
jgi:hypothetical protein